MTGTLTDTKTAKSKLLTAFLVAVMLVSVALPAQALIGQSPLLCDQNILVDSKDDPVASIQPKDDTVVNILKAGYTTSADSRTYTITITEMKGDPVAVIDPRAKTVTINKSGYAIAQPCED